MEEETYFNRYHIHSKFCDNIVDKNNYHIRKGKTLYPWIGIEPVSSNHITNKDEKFTYFIDRDIHIQERF